MNTSDFRSHYAEQLTSADLLGKEIKAAGWVQRHRDHGGVVFCDLRDPTGIIQTVLDTELIPAASQLRMEYCLSVTGTLTRRPEGTVNPDLPTGEHEITVSKLEVLSRADTLPFMIDDSAEVEELTRMEYRYLDLRRPQMVANLVARSQSISVMRQVLEDHSFLEIETPTLIASTPEGARDLLVPSRLRPTNFYALPQSPQLFKQLLMVAGVERYYQIARCYRDEDFRADRQIEFTQLDLEGSFWGRDQVLDLLEEIVVAVTKKIRNVELSRPFVRMTYRQAMDRFGTDKPDLRFGMEITDLGAVFANTGFQAFGKVLADGGVVRGINAGEISSSRSALDALIPQAKELGAKGLVWMVKEEDGWRSPIAKFLSETETDQLAQTMAARTGEVVLIAADQIPIVSKVLGGLRVQLGQPEDHQELAPLFVVDFPTFDRTETGELVPSHHPFTAPKDIDMMQHYPEDSLSWAYDLVLNGSELGSGSVRIHNPDIQSQVFTILGISPTEAEERFGWFLRALRFGTPPHAGFAVGIDRLVAILRNEPNIRQIVPFPKTQTGSDPLTGSPSPVTPAQLEELGLALVPSEESAE